MFNQEAKTMFGSLASEIEDRKCDPANSWIRGAHNCTLCLVSKTSLIHKEQCKQCKKCKIFSSPAAWHPAGDCYWVPEILYASTFRQHLTHFLIINAGYPTTYTYLMILWYTKHPRAVAMLQIEVHAFIEKKFWVKIFIGSKSDHCVALSKWSFLILLILLDLSKLLRGFDKVDTWIC